jgi:hypothetical protein
MSYDEARARIIRDRACPFCRAQPGQHCYSQFLGRPMENEIHRQRSLADRISTRADQLDTATTAFSGRRHG